MDQNPYEPPTASIGRVATSPRFFAVSPLKLAVMSLCTLGLYELFWFYKNWQYIKEHDRSRASPVWRSLFAIFFCYSCFSSIRKYGEAAGIKPSISAGGLATGWILASLAWRLPAPYSLLSLAAVAFMLPVQTYANRINEAKSPRHDPNTTFSLWNWLAVVLGGGILVLGVIGTFLPPAQG